MIFIITPRFGNGQGAEYAESYLLEYWRPRLGRWVRYRNIHNSEVVFLTMVMWMVMVMILTSQVMEGNSNTYLAAKQELSPVIIASKVLKFSFLRQFLLFTCSCSLVFFLLESIFLGDELCLKLWLPKEISGSSGRNKEEGRSRESQVFQI